MIKHFMTPVLVVSVACMAYHFGSKQYPNTDTVTNTSSASLPIVNKAQSDLAHQLNALKLEQAKVNTKMGELGLDIKFLLEQNAKHSRATLEEEDNGPDTNSDQYLAQHIDQQLEALTFDEQTTEKMLSLTEQNLKKNPGLEVTDFRCGGGICKATFVSVDGKPPSIDNMWGEPPLMNEGITEVQEDGSLRLYFTDADTSLEEIRISLAE